MKITKRILSLMLSLFTLAALALPAAAAGETIYGVGFVNTDGLRLRAEASVTSRLLDTAVKDDCVVLLSKHDGWYKVSYNLQIGYMYGEYLDAAVKENAELGFGTVTGSQVNLRSGPSLSFPVLDVTELDETCYIIGVNNGWYKVIYETHIGYIRSDYVALTEIPYENADSENAPHFFRRGKTTGVAPNASVITGEETVTITPVYNLITSTAACSSLILAEARKHLGAPYVNGGSSPDGFDCSGFVYYVLKQCGYTPYRTPASQYTMGTYVEKDMLHAGDLVFFAGTAGSGISHVGIYAGDGQFIHAPNSRSTVSYSDLTSGYWAEHYHGARRMA